jgi:hypothetical protein
MLDWLYDLIPMTIPSSLICDFDVGDLFEEQSGVYLLLSRDAFNARIVTWTKWTRIFWRKYWNGKSADRCTRT